jgi:hypothetical protein
MSRKLTVVGLGCLLVAVAAPAFAVPVQWTVASGGNGHFYEAVVAANTPWVTARTAAEQRTYDGLAGYLATFATGPEQDWVIAALGGGVAVDSMWLGGYQDFADPGYSEPAGGWKWITGEPFLLSGPDAPRWSFNNSYIGGSPEQYAVTWWSNGGINDFNDTLNAIYVAGYLVEYSPASSPVAEPASLSLLVLGAAGLLLRGQSRRQGR